MDNKKAPITTKNFIQYVEDGYYNGTTFHRVIPGFMVQGGGVFVKFYQLHPFLSQLYQKQHSQNHVDRDLKMHYHAEVVKQ